jgi:hypothetical protein
MDIDCSVTVTYEKFTIVNANAYDVLKKIQDDTKAVIYLQEQSGGRALPKPMLHIHNLYENVTDNVVYSFQHNIEESDLSYKHAEDIKIQVVLKTTLPDGKVKEYKYGTDGGEQKTSQVSGLSEGAIKQRLKNEYDSWVYDGYEGSITGWLIPMCAPAYQAAILDEEYQEKDGIYYVKGVETTFDNNGGKRKVSIGKKLGVITNHQISNEQ